MKRTLLIFSGLFCMAAASASAPQEQLLPLPQNFDPWNLNYKLPLEKFQVPETSAPAPKSRVRVNDMARVDGQPEEQQYFVVGQTFHSDYRFQYDGGAIASYNIGITLDGTKATISNMFNLEAQSTDWSKGVDYDVEGVYDAEAKTITIPTSSNFNSATIAGTIGDYYTCVLLAGNVTEDGKLVPEDNLVFNVSDDMKTITSDQNFVIMNYTNDGSMAYGMQTAYRRFYAVLPGEKPKLLAFNNTFDLGESYPDTPVSVSMSVFNISSAAADFAVDMEADADAFTAAPETGTIDALSSQDYTFTFKAREVGDYEGLATIEYDSDAADAAPIQVLLAGAVKPIPDYSAIVNSGEYTFSTSLEYPFEMVLTPENIQAARSTVNGQYGNSSLSVSFEVPEGNIGKFSWNGRSVNTGQFYQNAGGVFVDDAASAYKVEQGTGSIADELELAPGKHTIRFQYDGYYYTGDAQNGLYVYDLNLVNTAAPADKAEIETPEISLGNFILEDGASASGQATLILRNRGLNPLTVSKAVSDNSEFVATVPTSAADLLDTLEIPVIFNTDSDGEHTATVTLTTSAGEFKATLAANVIKMPDYSSLITEGKDLITSYATNPDYPYLVENGVAYNITSGQADTEATDSWFEFNFTVPEGKMVYLEWNGHTYGTVDQYGGWVDYGYVDFTHPMSSGNQPFPGEDTPADHEDLDEAWASYMMCIPGDHKIRFGFYKNGDGEINSKDRYEVSDIRLRLEDFNEHDMEADKENFDFEPIYVGQERYSTAVLTVKNTGSSPLEITDVTSDAPFYGVIPKDKVTVQFNQTTDLGVWFYPGEEGTFEGDVTFKTNAGDLVIHCTGSTLSGEGILLMGDVEDSANGWSFYDADRDGDCWNLGYNLWGEYPEWCHSGKNCFGSPSYTYEQGGIQPDNWLFSPAITIPADGAKLRWYAASHHHERYAEHYSVYIAAPEEIQDPGNLNDLTSVFSETLPEESADVWQEHVLDLKDYAGKQVSVCFRHHDCDSQYVLKVDDIFVYTNKKWDEISGGLAVDFIGSEKDVVSTAIYNVNGIRLSQPRPGVNIVTVTYSDGSTKTTKMIIDK